MSKTTVLEVGKRNMLRLPPGIAAEWPEGTKLTIKHGRNGAVTLIPVREPQMPGHSREEAADELRHKVDKLSRMADEKGVTEEDIQAAVKRIRARKYGTANGT